MESEKRKYKYLLPAALFLLALSVASTNLPGARFVWDDVYVIENNPTLKSLDSISSYFTSSWAQGTESARGKSKNVSFYRPIPQTLYTLEYAAWGENPAMFRLVNNTLHAGATVLVFLLLIALGIPLAPAAIGAALFAVHPVHTEVINVIAYRTTLLAVLFYLGALLAHVRHDGRSFVGNLLVALLTMLALLSKESAATLPAALVLLDLAIRRRFTARHLLARYLPVLIATAAYLCLRSSIVSAAPGAVFAGMGKSVIVFTMLKTMVLYARLIVVPWPLCAYYDPSIWPPTGDPWQPAVLGGVLLVVLWLVAGIIAWRKNRVLGALFFLVPLGLSPYLHIIPFRALAGERFLYLTSVPLCALAGIGFCKLSARRWRRPAIASIGAILVVFSGISVLRNQDWKTNTTIMTAKVRDFPDSFDANFSLGQHLLVNEHDPARAVHYLSRALEIWPDFPPAVRALQIAADPAGRNTHQSREE